MQMGKIITYMGENFGGYPDLPSETHPEKISWYNQVFKGPTLAAYVRAESYT